jgi:hypothetical protein
LKGGGCALISDVHTGEGYDFAVVIFVGKFFEDVDGGGEGCEYEEREREEVPLLRIDQHDDGIEGEDCDG